MLSVGIPPIVFVVRSNCGSTPTSSPMYSHHASMLVSSSPPQFTMVAGTDAAPSIAGSVATMSSSWIGLKRLGPSGCTGTGRPASISARWNAGQPPPSP